MIPKVSGKIMCGLKIQKWNFLEDVLTLSLKIKEKEHDKVSQS